MTNRQAPAWLGALFGLVGLGITAIALDLVPNDPSSLNTPRWVLGLCGMVFLGVGVIVLTTSYGAPWMSDAAAFVTIASMAVIGSWIAFGPGEREFSGSISLGPFAFGTGGVSLGRIVFGVGAFLTWLIALVPLWRIVASAIHPNPDARERAPG